MELSVLCTLLRLLQVKQLRFNGLKVKFDNYHQMVKNGFFTDTDLAKCIIMSAVGRFIICKVDRVMF